MAASACALGGRVTQPALALTEQPEICELYVDVPTVAACADQTTELAILPSGAMFKRPAIQALCITSFDVCAPSREARRISCEDRYCGPVP